MTMGRGGMYVALCVLFVLVLCTCVLYLSVRTVLWQPFVQDKSPSSCDRMTKILHVSMKRRLKGPRMDLLLGGSCE